MKMAMQMQMDLLPPSAAERALARPKRSRADAQSKQCALELCAEWAA